MGFPNSTPLSWGGGSGLGDNKLMKKYIKKYWMTALFIVLLVLAVYNKNWWGAGGLLVFISALQIIRVITFFKSVPWIKDMMLDHIKKWEAVQLGYDLDDEYWDGKTRPTRLQKMRGINPNMTEVENMMRRELNKEAASRMSFKQKYLSMFDYTKGSKAIFLIVSLTLAIVLIKIGLNILIVFALILGLGIIKKIIDKKHNETL